MKKFRIVGLLFIVIVCSAIAFFYSSIYGSNTNFEEASVVFYLRTGSSYNDLVQQLTVEGVLENVTSFKWTCRLKKMQQKVKPGRYRIWKGISNNELANMIRSGNQEPLMVAIENVHDLKQLAGLLGRQFESDSTAFAVILNNPATAERYGFTLETLPAMFIADTYECWWNTAPEAFLNRMKKNYDAYWTDESKAKAATLQLTPIEVSTLASIVKGETAKMDEAPKIAALYLNRLRSGMKLQADPTVIFAMGDYNVGRLYFSDYKFNSPYNTYLHNGLPPGPIAITDKHFLDAVLNPENHTYIYMCAKPDHSGYHNFSNSYEQHLVLADQYRQSLSSGNTER